MTLDDAIDDAQAEAGAFADRLGGVEGIEDALRIAQARSSIRKLNDQLITAPHGGDLQGASTGLVESVQCVFDDLDKNLKQLVGVGNNARAIAFDEEMDLTLAGRTSGL